MRVPVCMHAPSKEGNCVTTWGLEGGGGGLRVLVAWPALSHRVSRLRPLPLLEDLPRTRVFFALTAASPHLQKPSPPWPHPCRIHTTPRPETVPSHALAAACPQSTHSLKRHASSSHDTSTGGVVDGRRGEGSVRGGTAAGQEMMSSGCDAHPPPPGPPPDAAHQPPPQPVVVLQLCPDHPVRQAAQQAETGQAPQQEQAQEQAAGQPALLQAPPSMAGGSRSAAVRLVELQPMGPDAPHDPEDDDTSVHVREG